MLKKSNGKRRMLLVRININTPNFGIIQRVYLFATG